MSGRRLFGDNRRVLWAANQRRELVSVEETKVQSDRSRRSRDVSGSSGKSFKLLSYGPTDPCFRYKPTGPLSDGSRFTQEGDLDVELSTDESALHWRHLPTSLYRSPRRQVYSLTSSK